MFNFNELAIVQPNEPNCYRGSFVGIRKDKYLGKMAFTLPKGFENFKINYDNVKNLFFAMYRTFEKFRQNKERYLDKDEQNKDNAQIENNNGAYIFTDEDNNETVLYSKIDLIDKIFQTYQELEIESLIQELGLIEEVDYSKIENYLDKGIFLSNHAIFIETMVGYRNIVRGVPSELIELFCYIYKELASELEKELSEQIKEISFNFSYKYLSPEQSLFSEHSFESTISILKDCLDNIHKTTAYKNYQYWDIYEAVEHFLYGSLEFDGDSNQGFWGINNFSYIWEDMCNYVVLKDKNKKVLGADSYLPFKENNPNLTKERIWIDKNEIDNNFFFEMNGISRHLRPDMIFVENIPRVIGIEEMIRRGIVKIEQIKSGSINNILFLFNQEFEMEFMNEFDELFKFFLLSINKNKSFVKVGILNFSQNRFRNVKILRNEKYSFRITNINQSVFNDMYNHLIKEYKNNKNLIKECEWVCLMDWKYYSIDVFNKINYRNQDWLNKSIIKSLTYEFCLSQSTDRIIHNEFGIPCYDENSDDIALNYIKKLDCGIHIARLNFLKIQEIYLNG